jgi:hypothetical protein
MLKKFMLLTFLLIISTLLGCNPSDNSEGQLELRNPSENDSTNETEEKSDGNEAKVSPMFEAGSYTMIGEKGRIGFIFDGSEVTRFKPNREQKYMWHFWGEPEELEGKLKVIGTSANTGEEVTVFEAAGLGGPNNGADAHTPSSMSLPSIGIWELNAYVGGKLFGTVVVECRE